MRLRTRLKSGLILAAVGVASSVSRNGLAAPNALEQGGGTSVVVDAGPVEQAPRADPRTEEIRSLIDDELPADIEPQSLFDVPLADESAIQVEALRLRRLVVPERGAKPPPQPAVKPGLQMSGSAGGSAQLVVDAALVRSRDELDRARLDFYTLPSDRRAQLLEHHAARREAARPKETDAERNAREAEEEQQKALAAAREARSAAERTLAQELARLLGVQHSVELVRSEIANQRASLTTRRESRLGWKKRVHDARLAGGAESDETYDAIRKTLRAGRDGLARALDAAESGSSKVPDVGPDTLKDIPLEISTEQARKRREAVLGLIERARAEERSLLQERASSLLDEIDALNADRLELLGSLSRDKRAEITGFTLAGLDQARSEARQLVLILRYHRHALLDWLRELRRSGGLHGMSWWRLVRVTVPVLPLLLGFLWWRRRSPKFFALADDRLTQHDRSERRVLPSPLRRGLQVLRGVHRPLEWLLFVALTASLLPASITSLLEVQLLTMILAYSVGGALIVNLINSIAILSHQAEARSIHDSGQLRLRSLRLVGLVVVIFALVLVLSARLVGVGTLYHWVRFASWFAGLPVFLILVRWWRETVFSRVERARRNSAIQRWILANRSGWKSFFAAMIAAVQVFSIGAYRTVRSWVTRFELVRRAHAYLFKRELSRLAAGKSDSELKPLSAAHADSLSPDRKSDGQVDCPADDVERVLRTSVTEGRGGLVAVVGGRGQGKTTVLRRLAKSLPQSRTITCQSEWTVKELLRSALEQDHAAGSTPPSLMLIDDAQSLIKPIKGGLRLFDELLGLAKERSRQCLWVFAIETSLWPFLQRARDARPLFDRVTRLEPWRDDEIGSLLELRNREAGIEPTFEDLLEKSAATADEIDRQESLEAKRDGYFRMIWDYARGNPALALEVWRASLVQDSAGVVRVRSLVTPNVAALEELSDSALFIVRAILQMGPTSASEVSQATRVTEEQIDTAFRYGCAKGYLSEERGRVRITWRWLRPVIALLERRHLLVDS